MTFSLVFWNWSCRLQPGFVSLFEFSQIFKKKSQLTQNPTTTAMTMKPFNTRPFQDYDAVFTKIATISHYDHMCEARTSAKRTFGYKQRVQLTIYSAFRLCGGGGIDGLSIVSPDCLIGLVACRLAVWQLAVCLVDFHKANKKFSLCQTCWLLVFIEWTDSKLRL